MELTWITFPTIVVTVSLVAYYAAYLLKGNDLLVNKVDVVDHRPGLRAGARQYLDQPLQPSKPRLHDPDDSRCRWIAIHHRSPQPMRPVEPVRPPANTEVVTSWFSAPENQFGAMGNSGRRFSFAGSGYYLSAHVGSRVARGRPDSDLEHQVHYVALVWSGGSARRL